MQQGKEQEKKKFESFVPRQDVDLGIYEEALDYAMEKDEIKNIGIIGPYGAGKSSVIETYKVKKSQERDENKQNKLKFLHISLANFKEQKQTKEEDNPGECGEKAEKKKENMLEGQIINQLIYKICDENTPSYLCRKRKIHQ